MKRGEETRNAEFRNKNDTSQPAVRREPKLEGKVVGNSFYLRTWHLGTFLRK